MQGAGAYCVATRTAYVNFRVRLLDKIKEIGHNDANIEWFSDEDCD